MISEWGFSETSESAKCRLFSPSPTTHHNAPSMTQAKLLSFTSLFQKIQRNASGRQSLYTYVCLKQCTSFQMLFLANGWLSWGCFKNLPAQSRCLNGNLLWAVKRQCSSEKKGGNKVSRATCNPHAVCSTLKKENDSHQKACPGMQLAVRHLLAVSFKPQFHSLDHCSSHGEIAGLLSTLLQPTTHWNRFISIPVGQGPHCSQQLLGKHYIQLCLMLESLTLNQQWQQSVLGYSRHATLNRCHAANQHPQARAALQHPC